MQNKINIVAVSHEADTVNLEELNILAGKYGGTCYAADGYATIKTQPEEKARKRAISTANRGHHSVFQHSVITFEIICSKMIAIILNSIGVSNASEKSARYTVMPSEVPAIAYTYAKWCGQFQALISDYLREEFPNKPVYEIMTPSELGRVALDQARYMLSVFTPISIVYSIPYRNLCYLLEWMEKMADNIGSLPKTFFHRRLQEELRSVAKAFRETVGGQLPFGDNKSEFLHILPYQATGELWHLDEEIFRDVYQVERVASFAAIAHLVRHRTLTHWINFTEPGECGFYIPPLLTREGNERFLEEWNADIRSISEFCPQGTLTSFVEQGSFDKLILMCKERLCCRALLETQNTVKDILEGFAAENLSPFNRRLLAEHTGKDGKPCARCQFKDFICNDSCIFGGAKAFNRLI